MKVLFNKQPGGVLIPASDMEADKLTKFKTGEMYEVDIKNSRNPHFHGKVFAFLTFCFAHWRCDREFMEESAQFDRFRGDLTILAGYFDTVVDFRGDTRLIPKSLSFGSMSQEDFEKCYTALINAASKHIFAGADKETEEKLLSFF